jgi:deazaflavin-dependent oxidoreductase (nitroreductase family)
MLAAFHRLNLRIARSRAGAWLYARLAHHADRLVAAVSGGRASLAELLTGVPLVWLTTRGAKTGLARTLPLVGTRDGERVILIASNWGQDKHPAWSLNLRAHPEATLIVHGRRGQYRARFVSDLTEREACWRKAIANYAGYADYRTRTTREIPVIVMEPVDGRGGA